MLRKVALVTFALLVLLGLSLASLPAAPARAQGNVTPTATGDFEVKIEITGQVKALTANSITLGDNTVIVLTKDVVLPDGLKPGVTVKVSVKFDDQHIVALSIKIVGDNENQDENEDQNDNEDQAATPTGTITPVATGTVTNTGTAEASCGGQEHNPVAARLAQAFGVSEAEIMAWHCKGFGFGEIARAYLLAAATKKAGKNPLTVEQIFAMRMAGKGWGEIIKASGVNPKDLAPGQVGKGQGKNNGKGKGNANGKGKGNDDGNGNGKGNNDNNDDD